MQLASFIVRNGAIYVEIKKKKKNHVAHTLKNYRRGVM